MSLDAAGTATIRLTRATSGNIKSKSIRNDSTGMQRTRCRSRRFENFQLGCSLLSNGFI